MVFSAEGSRPSALFKRKGLVKMNKKVSNVIYKVLFLLCLTVFLGAVGYVAYDEYQNYLAEKEIDKLGNSISTEQETETQIGTEIGTETETEEVIDELAQLNIQVPEKNLDWNVIKEENEHIYAWIYIPGTNVDYPIVQHPTDRTFYLRRGLNGKKLTAGCIFTEHMNTTDFTDPNTLIYGHNMRNQTMFATIHNFEDKEFFENNRYIYIYMPDKVLVYDVFAAYGRDNKHLLLSYSYTSEKNIQENFDAIFKNEYKALFRDGVELTTEDKIISLSTCIRGEDDKRYIVQAVLVNPSALLKETVEQEVVEQEKTEQETVE